MMKKLLTITLALVLLFTLSACGGGASSSTPPAPAPVSESTAPASGLESASVPPASSELEPVALKPGFVQFESEYISFQYPERYTEWSEATKDDAAVRALMVEKQSEEAAQAVLETYHAAFYDYGETGGKVYPMIYINVEDAPGDNMDALHNNEEEGLAQMAASVETLGSDFVWLEELDFRSPGGMELLTWGGRFTSGAGTPVEQWQALWVENGKLINLTFYAAQETMDDARLAEIQESLATVR